MIFTKTVKRQSTGKQIKKQIMTLVEFGQYSTIHTLFCQTGIQQL